MKMDPYSTHQALVVAAVARTTGMVLEMGGGWYSTPLINSIAIVQQRAAITVETAEFVYNILKPFNGPHHSVQLMPGFSFNEAGGFCRGGGDSDHYNRVQAEFLEALCTRHRISPEGRISVAFIDQKPGFLRSPAIAFFADRADYVITHDSEHVEHYRLEPILSSFRYRFDFTLHRPNSVILSNYLPCDVFSFLKPPGAGDWRADLRKRRQVARKLERKRQRELLLQQGSGQ